MKGVIEKSGVWKKWLWVWLTACIILAGVSVVQAGPNKFDWDRPFVKPLNLIHITETGTPRGPVKKDVYILYSETPKDGVLLTADGSAGWFINKASKKGGPFNTPREVCNAVKGIESKKLSLPFSCVQMTPFIEKPSADEGIELAEKPGGTEQAGVKPTPLRPPDEEMKTEEEKECPTLKEELKRLQGLNNAIASIENEHQLLHYQISLMRLAVLKLQANSRKIDEAIKHKSATVMSHYGDVRWAKDWKGLLDRRSELGERISKFYGEQDKGIEHIKQAYNGMLNEVEAELRVARCRSVKMSLERLHALLQEKRDVGSIELYLVSGQREKFQKLAERFAENDRYRGRILQLQMMDHLEHQEMADALHTGREALKSDPGSKMLKIQIKDIELAYLEAIHAKVQGEAKMLRELAADRFDEFGEPGWWGYIKGFVDVGIVESTRAIWGDFDLLQRLESAQGKEAAVQHLGLMLMVRLRKTGMSWEQIRGLDNKSFMQEVNTRFKLKEEYKVGPKRAMKMRFSLMQAFRNPDVEKLFKPGRQNFAVDTGEQYFDTWEFEKTWLELLYDAIDVKNVAMLMPGAVVSVGGKTAWFSQGKYISGLSKEALASGTTLQDLFWTFKPIAKLTEWAGNTKTGSQCANFLLKFEAEASLPKKILLEALVQDGIVRVGAAVGGVPGHVAAEVLTSLIGVGDLDRAVRVLQRSGVAKAQVGQILKQLTRDLDRAASIRIPSAHRKALEDAVSEYAEKGVLSPGTRKLLKQKSEEMTEQLNRMAKRLEQVDPDSLEALRLKQAKTSQKALEEASEGRMVSAKAMKENSDQLEKAYQQGRKGAKKSVEELDRVSKKMGDGSGGSGSNGSPRKAGEDVPGVQSSDKARKKLAETYRQKAENTAQMFETQALRPEDPPELHRLANAGDKALAEGDISKAKDFYDLAQMKADALRKKASDPEVAENLDIAYNVLSERYKLAKAIEHRSRRILPTGSAIDGPVMQAIDGYERDRVVEAIEDTFQRVERATEKEFKTAAQEIKEAAMKKAQQERRHLDDVLKEMREEIYQRHLDREMPVLKTSAGVRSSFEPRVIKVGDQTYIYKASSQPDFKDLRGEAAGYQLAKELDRNTPACAKVQLLRGQEGTQSLITRFVKNAHDLSVADPETLIAMRQRVADDRVMSMFLGDADRHSANYLVGENGREFYSTDHGLSELVDSGVDYSREGLNTFRSQIKERVKEKYKYYLRKWGSRDPRMKLIDMHLGYDKHMKQMVERIQKLNDKAIKRIVGASYKRDTDNWQKALRTLMTRKDVMGDAIQEAIKEFKAGKVGRSPKKRKVIKSVCHLQKSLPLAA